MNLPDLRPHGAKTPAGVEPWTAEKIAAVQHNNQLKPIDTNSLRSLSTQL
jgi:hypothetical protein